MIFFLLAHWIWNSFVLTQLCYRIIARSSRGSCASGRWWNVDWRGCNCVYCVGSPQQQTPDEKAPQPPTHQDWVRRRDHAGAQSGARADVGRHPAGRAADHHVLHRQDHQVGVAVSFRSRPGFFLFICCCKWQQMLTDAAFYHLMDRKATSEVPHVSGCVMVVESSSHPSPEVVSGQY